MIKYVTFYEDIFDGITEVKTHKQKEKARDTFHALIKKHFDLCIPFMMVKIPIKYGNSVQKAYIMKYRDFCKRVKNAEEVIEYWKGQKGD